MTPKQDPAAHSSMKGFPPNPDGPRGIWYQKVNRVIAEVVVGLPRPKVIELLGKPDEVQRSTTSATVDFQRLMESVAGGPTLINYGDATPVQEILVYRDPYRTRSYCYGMHDGRIQSTWIQDTRTNASTNDNTPNA